MSTDTKAREAALTLYRLTARQFDAMDAADIFGDDRVELLGGKLIAMTQYPPHIFISEQVADALRQALAAADWTIREAKFVHLGRFWRPEPDLAVLRGPRTNYATRLPRAADLAFLVEVADTTYAKDRGAKWRRYAASKVPAYWMVDVGRRRIEVFTGPTGRGKSARYQDAAEYGEDAEVPVVIDGRELGRVAVRHLFP